jgi:NAD(P)-dependent dehydrogenase (short-subunit alcohol dehydrogenase family)
LFKLITWNLAYSGGVSLSPSQQLGTTTTNPMAPDTLSLAGKVAIITGSGRENGIGGRIAKTLALNGAAVTINYVSEKSISRAEEVAQSIRDLGARVAIIRGSIETQEGASKIVSDTMEAFGVDHIDILGK